MQAQEVLQAIVDHCDTSGGALHKTSALVVMAREVLQESPGVSVPVRRGLSDEDKARRRHTLGSSEVAAVLGVNPWASAHSVWLSKVHGDEFDGNERTELGQMLEPTIMGIYAERYSRKIVKGAYTLGPEPWMSATPDGLVVNPDGVDLDDLEAAPLCEAKLVGLRSIFMWGPGNSDEQESDEVPQHYLCQGLWQLACRPRAPFVDVSALLGTEFRSYRIRRNERVIAQITAICRDWWHRYVVTKTAPPVDGSEGARSMLKKLYPQSNEQRVPADEALERIAAELHAARAAVDAADAAKALAENQMREALKDCGGAYGDGWSVSYKTSKDGKRPLKFDDKKLKEKAA